MGKYRQKRVGEIRSQELDEASFQIRTICSNGFPVTSTLSRGAHTNGGSDPLMFKRKIV